MKVYRTQPKGKLIRINFLAFIALFFSLTIANFSKAQFTSVTNETLVNTTTAGEQWAYWWSVRTIAVQPDGGYISIWIDNNGLDGSGQGIFGQRFNASGAKVGGEFQVNTTTTGDQFSPSVAVAPNGSFLVAWEGPGTSTDVFGQFFSKSGVKMGTEFLISTVVIGNQKSPEVQYYPDGTFVAGYVDGGQSVLQRFDAEGRTLGLETRISSGTGDVVIDGIAIRPDKSLVMTWESGGDVYGQFFSSTLQPIGSQTRINTFTAGTQEYVVCRADDLGNFVAVWQSHGQDGSGIGIYGRRYDNNFNPLSGEFAITTNTTGDQIEPQIAMEPGGRFIIAWTDYNNRDGGGPDGTSVWIREFNNSGTAVGVETRVNQSITGYQGYPVIDMNASGRIALDWEANGTQPGQIDNYGVFTRAYQLTQTGTTTVSVVPTNGIASDIVTVTMTLTNPTSIANVKPNPLSVSGTNDVFATLISGPSPASATVGTSPVNFTWTYRLTANGSSGSLTFGGNAHSSAGAIFPYATSNSISVKPALYLSDITAPNLIGDQNVEPHPEQGPRVFTIGAKITNAGLTPLTEVKLYLGDGVTPGVFPVTTMTLAQTNNTYQGSFSLIPLGGAADCSRSFISLAPSKAIIAGGIDFNGDNVVNASDDGVLGNGKTVIDGRVDANLSGTVTIADDIPAPPGVFTGYREPPVIDGYIDVNRDGVINASDNGTYGGEIKNVYWQVNYKVIDAFGKPTWGNTADYADDLRYKWSIWTSSKDGAVTRTDMVNDFAKVRSEISALANKITPNPDGYISGGPSRVIAGQVDVNSDGVINSSDDGFYYTKPVIDGKVDMNNSGTITTADDGLLIGFPVIDGFIDVDNSGTITSADDGLLVQPGQTFTITVHNAEFGTIGAGFDENRDNLWDLDFWYQPVGEVNWPSGSFRLIDIQADITGHGGNNPLNNITTHYSNEPYLSRLFDDNNGETGGFRGTYSYTFQAISPANGVLSPYQEAASGTNNEKYNGDYGVGVNVYVGGSLLCLGDRIWKDDNGNGIQDAGEVGIAGVTVALLDVTGKVVATTTTDAFGNYKFCDLLAGLYTLKITPPSNYSLSPKTQGGDTNTDSDFDPISYTTGTITLLPGISRTDIDAGLKFIQPSTASIGDRVWLDTNGDGVQDAGEPGMSNVLVTLYNSSGVPVASTYTDANGYYLFTDVAPGTYTIGVSMPPAMVFSPNNGVVSGTTNSDIIPATGRTASFIVNAGDQITYVDAGLKPQSSSNGTIGDFVWNDVNKNGIQDAGEPGIAGVTVRLVNATTNTIIATTTTDATGKYIFNDVPAGNYKIEFVTPAGYTTTTKLNSNVTLSGTDSDVDPATGRTATFTLGAGERVTSVDAGYWVTTPPGTGKIGDRVWYDTNQNGVQDAGETNVSGVTVILYNSGGTAIKQATTDQNGNYLFTDLAAASYTVGFSNLPAGFTFTITGAGTAATGSDANPGTGRTGTISLAAAQINLDVDAGIRPALAGTASIGNKVWYDLNNNGLQDAGEPGMQGVTVELLDGNGNPIDSDPATAGIQPTIRVTNALGEYLFTGLPAGDYKVRFSTLPAGYNPVAKAAGTDRSLDSDGNPISGGSSTTDVISVASGDERLDIDLGLFNPTAPLGQVGDRVWFDANNNGIQDTGEQGVPGVSVSLVNSAGAVVATTVTDGNGIYKFVNVADDVYWVQFSNLPAGFNFSGQDLGGNDNTDSDADPLTGTTATFFVVGGSSNMTIDAGIYSTRAALGDYVWFDADSDGIQDAGEKGIAGITVILYDASNNAVASAITDQNGRYFFSNLNPGSYTVGFSTIPGKLVFTLKDVVAAGDDADSDVDPATGKTGTVTLVAGQVNLTVDAGLRPVIPASIGDFVWNDLNNNGIQDAGEPGVPGVIVTLYNSANQQIGSAVTDGNGYYLITNVPPGTGYYIQFSNLPANLTIWTLQNVGGVAANNNSKADATGQTGAFNVTEGQIITNMDAGLLLNYASLGDRVWKDDNGNGIQDPGEVGVAGVTLVLLNSAGQVVATTTTDANGNYLFKNIPPGNYSVRITPPANYTLSAKTQGSDTNLDSDFDVVSYTTGTVTLLAGQNRTDIDAGLKFNQPQPASIGDRVWYDINGDGVQDANEPGLSNVLVTLYNSSGVAVASMYTDANGFYLFTNVAPGNYTIGVSLPPAMVFSPNNGAVSVGNNSDINPANGRTATFTVNAGDQIRYVDAGLKTQISTNASVGDFVWNDLNKDGVQDAGEPGIAGVTVRLVNATTNTIIATTVTDPTGKYIFNDVTPGNYLVDFVTPAGYTITTKANSNVRTSGTDSDVDPATGRTATFTLASGERLTTADGGYWVTTPPGTGKIGDRVWHDANQNGIQDAGEPNVSGITVTLYDAGGIAIKQATTDQNGNYIFTDLAAGNYTVGFSNLPNGYTFTTAGLGTTATGSDANPATGRTGTITLAAAQTNLDVDAGIRSAQAGTGSIGNRVWYDLNNNGLQDAGEVGVQGATVELLDAAGNPIDKDPITPGVQPTTTITNGLGEYLFTGLGAGDYKIRFSTLPAGYAVVTKGAGTDRNLDSDGNPLAAGTSVTDVVSISANEDRLDIDLGIFNPTAPLGIIGDRVWFDSNNNGIQDAGEQGVPGVSVSLLNASGNVVMTTVTDKDGLYKFVNVADATYTVQFSNLPAGFSFSPKDIGGNDNLDSDADPVNGRTGTYVVSGGNTNLTVDAGIYSTRAILGDYVWFDADSDGIQDAGENGIPGVTVILYDANNVAVTSAVTDQNGRYYFSNLNPGTYTVGFTTIPSALVFTIKDAVAAGDAADSDVNPATGKTGSYTLVAGQVNLTVDAGLKPVIPASVGDFVWLDLNRNGLQDAGEPGVPGVIATLYNSANQPIGSAVTDGNGYYLINNVPPGTGYYVQFSNQPDPAAPWTLQNVGGTGATNNSKADATGKTTVFDVAEGQNVINIDGGLFKLINLSGNVWHDVNAMNDNLVNNTGPLQSPPASLIPVGIRVYLVNTTTGLIERSTIVSSATGTFNFNNINPNTTYRVYLSSVAIPIGTPETTFPLVTIIQSGWEHTGQKNANPPNPVTGSDSINDGKLTVPVGVNNVININFGIRVSAGDVVQG